MQHSMVGQEEKEKKKKKEGQKEMVAQNKFPDSLPERHSTLVFFTPVSFYIIIFGPLVLKDSPVKCPIQMF